MEANSQKDFEIDNNYFFGERYEEYTIETIEKIRHERKMRINGKIHESRHNYIIIQAKFVKIDLSDCVTPKLYRNVNN